MSKNSPGEEERILKESHNQMIENTADNLSLLLEHGGLKQAELLLIFRTRIKPDITLSILSNIPQCLQEAFPNWWDSRGICDIVDLANGMLDETVNENSGVFGEVKSDHSRIDKNNSSLTDGERKLGKSYTAIIQEMRNHYEEHQERVDRFFYEHTVVYAKLSDEDHIACICFDPKQLGPAAKSTVCIQARKALQLLHSSSIEYTIILLSLDEIAKLSHVTDSLAWERLYAQLKGGRQTGYQASRESAQGSMCHLKLVGETAIPQQESQHELMILYDMICNECSQLGKAITGEDKIHQNNPVDSTPLPFLNQFP